MPSKNSSTGPLAAVTEQDLHLLFQEVTLYEGQVPQTQPDIRAALRTALDTWGKIYHTLVWLTAAKDPPKPNELIILDANRNFRGLPDSYIVPAFSGSEAGSGPVLGGYIFGLQAIFNDFKDDQAGGILFQEEAYQEYAIDGVVKPLLQHFFDKYKQHRTQYNFDLDAFKSKDIDQYGHQPPNPVIFFHPKTAEFINEALFLLQDLWGNRITQDLKWVNAQVDKVEQAGSRAWLDDQFGINRLDFSSLFVGNDIAGRQLLNNATVTFALSREIFGFVYDRFADQDDRSLKSDGLESVIAMLTSQSTSFNHLGVWSHLITATYGAVAMRLFRQTESLVNLAKSIG